jgi:hypothetical protein
MRFTWVLWQSSKRTTVEIGTAFEERARRIARAHLSMALTRVGGKSDGGIDLQGWWWLPVPTNGVVRDGDDTVTHGGRRRLRVIAQCKAEAKKLGPNYVRELEGVLFRLLHAPSPGAEASSISESRSSSTAAAIHSTGAPLVAVLVSQSPFSREALIHAKSSKVPFLLLHVPEAATVAASDAKVNATVPIDAPVTAFWNPALGGANGLLRGEIEVRWERSSNGGRPGIWRNGERISSWVPEPDGSETVTQG